ncbi:MAG TPA: Sapep family Mn(2+)-dependent dipeptidase [Thermoanaerobaculia bacterium]|nr:Sapep family Mn(2+)-dependent dipeptidase [Thermoanaerobaculia bacterium]
MILAAVLATALAQVEQHYNDNEAARLVPMLSEVIRFETYEGNAEAHAAQKAWLMKTADEFGFVARDAGKITEIELPGPPNAPILGLVIHGDVQPVDPDPWSFKPFGGVVEDGYVKGRGAADDKGPLIQALLVMKALKESGVPRTHTIRLLVGSEEESSATEMAEYLKTHAPPDYSLVLDSEFPVVVGEKAWDALTVTTKLAERPGITKPYKVQFLDAGLAPSIVPDRAEIKLVWSDGAPDWEPLQQAIKSVALPEGTRIAMLADGDLLRVVAYGKSAHSGVNIAGGRNALVALARALDGKLPSGGANDLLAFVRTAGVDLAGTGLGIRDHSDIWGRYTINIATIKPAKDDAANRELTINLRRIPPRTAAQIKQHLFKEVARFNKKTGASLVASGYFEDEPLGFDPKAKIVKRLMADYTAATGETSKPAISGGGTYAKRLPNAIAFGMWFPGKPYPGHDVDEMIPIADLERGAKVLLYTLTDIATGPRMVAPFRR